MILGQALDVDADELWVGPTPRPTDRLVRIMQGIYFGKRAGRDRMACSPIGWVVS
jgi:hypothetical protein